MTNTAQRIRAIHLACKIQLILLVLPLSVAADEGTSHSKPVATNAYEARIYRNPEERREAGLGTQLTDSIKFSGLLEIEKEYFENNLKNNQKQREYGDTTTTAQFAIEYSFVEWMTAEFIYEVENDSRKSTGKWDEVFVSFDFERIGVGFEIGRVSAPFGEYYSHFVTGPLLEFGETIRDGLIVDFSPIDSFEITGFLIDSSVEKVNKNTNYDWGAGVEYVSGTEFVRLGLGYLSDLAESDERFLQDDNNEYEDRVSAWNTHVLIGFDKFEITAEYVHANDSFREFNNREDRPSAYNVEFAYFLSPNFQIATRYEGSDEFAEQPNEQYGISVAWRPVDRMSIAAEYLHGNYKNNFVFDDEDNELEDRDLIAAQLSIEF